MSRRHAVFSVGNARLAVVSTPLRVPHALTHAEREVAALIVEGQTDAQIAKARKTSKRTVANQVRSILAKLGVDGRRSVALALLR